MYQCRDCKLSFNTVSEIANHKRWKHKNKNIRYQCKKCEKDFGDNSNRVIHENSCSGKIKEKGIIELDTLSNIKCEYGCNSPAMYILKSGKKSCSIQFQNCFGFKLKNKIKVNNTLSIKTICTHCGGIFSNQHLKTHQKYCTLDTEKILKIRGFYDDLVALSDIKALGYTDKEIVDALKGYKKRNISGVLKRSHKLGRMNKWRHKESYAEKFFNECLSDNGYIINKDYFREFPFSFYRTDFFFLNLSIVIEIDGQQHFRYNHQKEIDKRKDSYLKNIGIDVLRIPWKSFYSTPKQTIAEVLDILRNKPKQNINNIFEIFNRKQLERLSIIEEIAIKNKKLIEDRKKEKNLKIAEKRDSEVLNKKNKKLNKINASDKRLDERRLTLSIIDFTKFGWVTLVAKAWGVTHTQAKRFIKRNLPDIYQKCYERKTSKYLNVIE